MKRTVETREIASSLAQRGGGYFCHYCNEPVAFFEDIPDVKKSLINASGEAVSFIVDKDPSIKILTVDHKIPKAKGGSDDLDNLLLSCTKCNQRKGKKDYSNFLKWLRRKEGK